MQKVLFYPDEYATVPKLEKGLQEYIIFYNYERPHQSLSHQVPADVHAGRVECPIPT